MITTATIETSLGTIVCKLFPQSAPETVANFVALAKGAKSWRDPKTGETQENVPLYNETIFHRVIPNFMIQGGDPLGTGTGGPGYRFRDEFDTALSFNKPGILAMANAGPNTNGSQFFITEAPALHLNNAHTIFGEVINGMDIVSKIAGVSVAPMNRPVIPVVIKSITIAEVEEPASGQ